MANQKTSQGNGGNGASKDSDYGGDGPGKRGVTSDNQPDLVGASGVDGRDHGSSGEAPMSDRNGPRDPERGNGKKPA